MILDLNMKKNSRMFPVYAPGADGSIRRKGFTCVSVDGRILCRRRNNGRRHVWGICRGDTVFWSAYRQKAGRYRRKPDEPRASSKNYDNFALSKKLHDRYIEEYGTVICHSIHRKLYGRPFSIADPDEKRKFEEAGAHDWGCTSVCGNAAKWTVEIYEEYLKQKGEKE